MFGFLGQLIFGARFFVQWILSEIKKKSYVPTIFWYLSLCGGIVLFIYALHKKDAVFIVGQGVGILIYARNIVLIKKQKTVPVAQLDRVSASGAGDGSSNLPGDTIL